MSRKTIETLVREVVVSSYDGKSVTQLDLVEVEITWPDDAPDTPITSHLLFGGWRVAAAQRKG